MATATLVMNVGKLVTTSSDANKLRQVIVPIGTQTLKMSSTAGFYLDFAGTADEGAETTASQFYYVPGTYYENMWTLGGRTTNALRTALTLYFIGAGTAQSIWFHATGVR